MMTLSEAIWQELKKRGFQNMKMAAKFLGISPEFLRIVVRKGHIPKDTTIVKIAEKLGLDQARLILAAHHHG